METCTAQHWLWTDIKLEWVHDKISYIVTWRENNLPPASNYIPLENIQWQRVPRQSCHMALEMWLMFSWRTYSDNEYPTSHVICLLKCQIACKVSQLRLQVPNVMNSSMCQNSFKYRKDPTHLVKEFQGMRNATPQRNSTVLAKILWLQ